MSIFSKPIKKSIIYNDPHLYFCLARDSIARGHSVLVWKKEVRDLKMMPDRDYDYLMDTLFAARNALMKTLGVKKVYLIYMDESNHVHWHLVPRYKEKGFDLLSKKPKKLKDFSLVEKIEKNLIFE